MFNDLVSPLISVSLPIRESSKTTSYNFEKEPMIESLTIEKFTIVFSPIATFGPTIEFLISHPSPILTGGIKIVFSNIFDSAMVPPNFLSSMAFDISNDSFLPQSNQFSTLNGFNSAPLCIMHSRASVRLNSS